MVNLLVKISRPIVNWLLRNGAVTEEDAPAYEYVVYRAIFTVIPLLMTLVIATLMKMTAEGLLMIIPFILIRRFCGGLHLNSSVVCFISSSITLIVALLIIRLLINYEMIALASAMAIISAASIVAIGSVESKNRPLSPKEKKVFTKVSRILCVTTLVVFTVFLIIGKLRYAVPIGIGLFLTAILQILGKIKQS